MEEIFRYDDLVVTFDEDTVAATNYDADAEEDDDSNGVDSEEDGEDDDIGASVLETSVGPILQIAGTDDVDSEVDDDDAEGFDDEDEPDPMLQFSLGDTAVTLDLEGVTDLVAALKGWLSQSRGPKRQPQGIYFQVYYCHEDGDPGEFAYLNTATGEDDDSYTWDESDLKATLERIEDLGKALLAVREAAGKGVDDDDARAWVSVFRMPDDVRIWKGPFSEFSDDLDAGHVGD